MLPAKANKSDVHAQLSSKANLLDMKKTMAEVAANIESRVTYDDAKRMMDDRVSRQDLHFQLQAKPSFDDIKMIVDQMCPQNTEMLEDELAKLRQRVDELARRPPQQAISQPRDVAQFQASIDQRFAEVEEKLNEKANKQSVAQALHRKANKPDVDAVLAKKGDLQDLQRIVASLEHKIDVGSFEALVRAVEMKADRHELS